MGKLLLSYIFYYHICPFFFPFQETLTISDSLVIFQSIFNASSQFFLQLSFTCHSSYGWGSLQCHACLSIRLPKSLQVLRVVFQHF